MTYFDQWWTEYAAKLHRSRSAAGLHAVSLSTLVAAEEAARAAWEAGRAAQVESQHEYELDNFD